jgi:hypothetical protein
MERRQYQSVPLTFLLAALRGLVFAVRAKTGFGQFQ